MVVNSTGVENSTSTEALPTRQIVLGMAHRDGRIIGAELFNVAQAVGLSVDQVRSCVRRLVNEGLFDRQGEGREAVFTATEAGAAALNSTLQRHLLGYHQDTQGRGWDRKWRIVGFAVPESNRAARDVFRDTLRQLGAAAIHPGLYVSPHDFHAEVVAAAKRLEIERLTMTATTDDLELGGTTDPKALASALWPLDLVANNYTEFVRTYRQVPADLEAMLRAGDRIAESEFIPGALRIAISFAACFDADPLLPPEMLPKPWPGREARQILARCRKLGLMIRGDKSGPALFSVFDEVAALMP